jgi:peroxiredoxin
MDFIKQKIILQMNFSINLKNIGATLLFCFITVSICAQKAQEFTIKGTLTDFSEIHNDIYLIYPQFLNKKTEHATIKNNQYEFKGTIQEPTGLTLSFDSKPTVSKSTAIIVSPGCVKIISTKTLRDIAASGDGAKAQNIYIKLTENSTKLSKEINEITAKEDYKTNADLLKKVNAKATDLIGSALVGLINHVKENHKSTLNPYLTHILLSSHYVTPEMSDTLYAIVKGNAKPTLLMKGIDSMMTVQKNINKVLVAQRKEAEAKTLQIGQMSKPFEQQNTIGEIVSLASYKGNYVLLDFWASWCKPCRAENPNVVKAYKMYKDKGFDVLGISLDGKAQKDNWLAAIKNDGLEWMQLCDFKGGKNEVAVMYGVQSIPQNYLIDPNGKIIAKNLRSEDLEKTLARIFDK